MIVLGGLPDLWVGIFLPTDHPLRLRVYLHLVHLVAGTSFAQYSTVPAAGCATPIVVGISGDEGKL